MLDLTLRTDDGASFPIGSIPDGEYTVAAETLDHNIVTLAPPHLAHTITVMAVTPGSGDLVRVSVAASDLCPATKQPRPLAVGLGHVDIDFDELTQSDASYYHHRQASPVCSIWLEKLDAAAGLNKNTWRYCRPAHL